MSKGIEEVNKLKQDWTQRALALGYTTTANLMASLYPVDFEAYQISFELCDSEGTTLDYFSFPIMPSELSIKEDTPVKIENTFGGVNSISSNVFVPKDINLGGNFGRQFKIIVRNKVVVPFAHKVTQERDYGVGGEQREELEVSNMLKSGYGCLKVLQSIINRAVEVTKGECNKLYFYNMAFGESYVVKPISFRAYQNTSNNGIWSYDLNLKAVCPLHLDAKDETKTKLKTFAINSAQSGLNSLTRGLKGTLNIM